MQQNQKWCLLKIGLLIVAKIYQFQGVLWHYLLPTILYIIWILKITCQ